MKCFKLLRKLSLFMTVFTLALGAAPVLAKDNGKAKGKGKKPRVQLLGSGTILREANALLSGDLRRGMYVTVLLAVLDPQAATLTLANAGHAPLLLCRQGKLAPVHSEGIALGFDKGPVFDSTLKAVRLPLHPGDRVVLYTPGVTRVQGADGQPLGEERFVALVRREAAHPPQAFVARMAALVRKFRGEAPQNEGVTLLVLGRLDGGGTPT